MTGTTINRSAAALTEACKRNPITIAGAVLGGGVLLATVWKWRRHRLFKRNPKAVLIGAVAGRLAGIASALYPRVQHLTQRAAKVRAF
jgi:hypothetical protein